MIRFLGAYFDHIYLVCYRYHPYTLHYQIQSVESQAVNLCSCTYEHDRVSKTATTKTQPTTVLNNP